MAAILKLRRDASASPSLVDGELFLNYTTGTVQFASGSTPIVSNLLPLDKEISGSIILDGDITGSNLLLTGDITARDFNGRDIRLSGNIYLGDEVADNIVTTGQFSGSLIPSSSELYDLGSNVRKWNELHVDSAFIYNSVELPGSRIMSSSLGTYQDFDSISSSLDSRLDNLNLYTQSNDQRVNSIEVFTQSIDNRVTTLEITFSSSVDSRLDTLNLYTQSNDQRVNSIEVFTQSVDFRVNELETFSGSEYQSDSSSFDSKLDNINLYTQSNDQRVDSLEVFTQSVDLRVTDLESTESDQELRIYNLELSQSFFDNTFSGSVDDRLDSLEIFSESLDAEFLNTNGDNVVSGSSQIDIEQTTNYTTFSSSLYTTDTELDSRISTLETTFSSSVSTSLDDLESIGSNHESRLDTIETTFSSSVNSRLDNLNLYTQSNDTRIDGIDLFTSSQETKNTTLESYTSSVDQQLDSIHSYTSSLKTAIDVTGQDLTVFGNLLVQGETTTINTQELLVEDSLLAIASGSTTSAQADGAGFFISGANASILWNHTDQTLDFNTKVSSSIGFKGDGSELVNIDYQGIIFDGSGIVSGSSQIDLTQTTNYVSGIKTRLNAEGIISGSDQVTQSLDGRYLKINGDDVVSGSSQIQIDLVSGFQTYSSSVDIRLDSLELFKDVTYQNDSSSFNERVVNLELTGSNHESRLDEIETGLSSSFDERFDKLNLYTQSNDQRVDSLEIFTESIDNRVDDLELFSSSLDVQYLNTDGDSVVSGSDQVTQSLDLRYLQVVGNSVVSGSDQVTQSLDLRYLEIGGDNVVSSSHQVTESLDLRYEPIAGGLNTLVSSSLYESNEQGIFTASINDNESYINVGLDISSKPTFENINLPNLSSLPTASEFSVVLYSSSGEFTYSELGTSAYYHVSQSISQEDDNVIGTAGALKRYIDEQLLNIGAGDITEVTAGDGISGGAESGEAILNLDTGSQHFINGVNGVVQLGDGVVSGSDQVTESLDTRYVNETDFTPFSSSVDTRLDELELFSSSLDGDYVTELEFASATQSLQNSIDTKLDSSSFNSYTQSTDLRLNDLESFSSSLNNEFVTQLELGDATSSLINSIDTKLDSSSFNSYTQSNDLRVGDLESFSSSIDITIKTKMNLDEVISGSSQIIDGSGILSSSVQDFDTFSGSVDSRLDSQELFSSSINDTIKTKMNLDEVLSGSAQLTGSLVTLDTDQTISGTKTFQDIIVNGTGSFSYIVSTTGSAKIIGDSYIILNNDTPTERYAGLKVFDSGSINTTASLEYDGQSNDWFYQYTDDGGVTDEFGVVLFGPEYSGKGIPTYPTNNTIQKGNGGHHLLDSNITDNGSIITLGSDVQANGNISLSGTVDGIDLQNFSSSVDGRLDTLEETSNENPLTFSDSDTIDFTRVGDTITADIIDGSVSNTKLTNSSITINGTAVSLGGTRTLDTDDVQEDAGASNKYFTEERVRVSVSAGGDLGYNSTTGEFSVTTYKDADVDSHLSGGTGVSYSAGEISIGQSVGTSDTVEFGKVGVGGASDATYELKVTGDIGATGDVVAYVSSDRRLKDEITPIQNSLQKINSIGGYSFVWNENQHIYKGKDYGVIAQEIEEILPELVETRENGYKAVKYDRIVSLLIEGVKELSKEVSELKKQIGK